MALALLQPCCCVIAGPWDFYSDASPYFADNEAYNTPNFSRTAAIYLNTTDPDSYADWYVTIPDSGNGRDFQDKTQQGSILAANTGEEVVHTYIANASGTVHRTFTFRFSADAMGFAEAGSPSWIDFAWNAGHIEWTLTDPAAKGHSDASLARATKTWADLRIESQAVSIELLSFKRKVTCDNKLSSHSLAIRLRNGAGTLLGTFYNAALPTVSDGSWITLTGAFIDLSSILPAAGDTLKIDLEYSATLNSNSGDPAETCAIDELKFELVDAAVAMNANASFDSVTRTMKFIVTDADWEDFEALDDDGNTYNGVSMGNVIMQPMAWSGFTNFSARTVAEDGVRRWEFGPTFPGYQVEYWHIDSDGDYTYEKYNPYVRTAAENSGQGTGYTTEGVGPHWDESTGDPVDLTPLSFARPVGAAMNSNHGVGIHFPHVTERPAETTPWPSPAEWPSCGTYALSSLTYDAIIEIHAGELSRDDDGFPFVSGLIWTETLTDYHNNYPHDPGSGTAHDSITVTVDGFDGHAGGSIAVATWTYFDDWTTYNSCSLFGQCCTLDDGSGGITIYAANDEWQKSVLIVNGHEAERRTVYHNDNGSYPGGDDNRDYYPFWVAVRALQQSEGGSQRFAAFRRVPWNYAEASALYAGNAAVADYKLIVYHSSGTGEWDSTSRNNRNGHANGTITLTGGATISMTAIGGSDADGTAANGTVTVNVDDAVSEQTSYDTATKTLTVKIDIAGGNDTVDDLAAMINQGGDFSCSVVSGGATPITGSTTGTGTFSGGDDGHGTPETPQVHTSSDRYMYVTAFPQRVYTMIGNRRVACFADAFGGEYPRNWMITHDGGIWNPVGIGADRAIRDDSHVAVGSLLWDSIKNSAAIPLTPLEELI